MSLEVSIRPATKGDARALVDFNRAIARETEGKELALEVISAGVEALLENPRHGFYLVAESAGDVVGALMVTFEWSDWRNGIFWWIQSVYVKRQFRGQGIYRKLYQEVKRRARREANVCGFRLYVEKENRVAQKAYRALGMTETHYKVFEEIW